MRYPIPTSASAGTSLYNSDADSGKFFSTDSGLYFTDSHAVGIASPVEGLLNGYEKILPK